MSRQRSPDHQRSRRTGRQELAAKGLQPLPRVTQPRVSFDRLVREAREQLQGLPLLAEAARWATIGPRNEKPSKMVAKRPQ
jgi:hypothetical protein